MKGTSFRVKSRTVLASLGKWARTFLGRGIPKRFSGLKTKITLFIILNVVTVIFLFSYLDYRLSYKDQIDFYLDRNLYIAKQIDIGISDPRNVKNLPRIRDEIEEWLLSRPSLMEIDLFVFTAKGLDLLVSTSKSTNPYAELTPRRNAAYSWSHAAELSAPGASGGDPPKKRPA